MVMASTYWRRSEDVINTVSSGEPACPSLASINISQQYVRILVLVLLSTAQKDPNRSYCPPERMGTAMPCSSSQMSGTSRESLLSWSHAQKLACASNDTDICPEFHSLVAQMSFHPCLINLLWAIHNPILEDLKKIERIWYHCLASASIAGFLCCRQS